MKELGELRGLKQLRSIDIRRGEFTALGLTGLSKALPGVKIRTFPDFPE